MSATEFIPGTERGILLVADHSSSHVPADIDLGVDGAMLRAHVALDIGVDPLARSLCETLGCAAVLAGVSRLVIDLNREEDSPGLIPTASDGREIPGNQALGPEERQARIERFFHSFHAAIDAKVEKLRPRMILSLHSFTPSLQSRPEEARPWQIGILYNRDERAARIAIPMLEAAGIVTGDNQPYSGRLLNATMNRHSEARGLPYLGIEVRQDLIGDDQGVQFWAARLAPVIGASLAALPDSGQ